MSKEQSTNRPIDERESSILRAVVHDYIATGKPVGSRSFVQKYSLSLSPATMRNIMFDLESMDYLTQPHTSAGRIPTDKGYRFYVNALLDSYDPGLTKIAEVKPELLKRELQLDKVFSSITKMLSNVSRYSGVLLTPHPDQIVIKRIELVPLDNNEVLVIFLTRMGMIINKRVVLSVGVTLDMLNDFSRFLTSELCGYPICEIRDNVFMRLRSEKGPGMERDLALDIAELALGEIGGAELFMDGIENLLKISEMVEEQRLASLLHIIEEKAILKDILGRVMEREGIIILIGDEIADEKVWGCSMVTTNYKIGNRKVGVIGVIGPTRMDYEKVVPLVDYAGRVVSDYLTQMSK